MFTAHHNHTPLTKLTSLCSISNNNNNKRRSGHIASARKGLSSRSGRSERKKGSAVTTNEEEEEMVDAAAERGVSFAAAYVEIGGGGGGEMEYSTEPMLRLEGLETDFWEGPSAGCLLNCGGYIRRRGHRFQANPVYKESIQSRELLEEPEASNSDVCVA